MNYLNFISFIIIIILTQNCTNTRVVVEGVKTVINKKEDLKSKKEEVKSDDRYVKGHYKVGSPYEINNITYTPKLVSYYDENGLASWYGPKFNNKVTANGEVFNQDKISAAHKTLPLPSIVKVTNLNNKKFMYIRINDRGPFVNNRIIDLSKQAAIELNMLSEGVARVNVKLIESGPHLLERNFTNQNYLEEYAEDAESSNKNKSQITKFLQLGVFSVEDNALNFKKKIKTKFKNNNFNIYIKELTIEKKIFKVILGPFYDDENIKNVADNLLEFGYNSLVINKEEK